MLWASKGLNINEVLTEAGKMDFSFFIYSGIMALAAHFSRAVRWRYLINSFGYHPKMKNVFLSVLFMYFSNLIIPRSGEVARCGTLYKYEKIPVKNLLGTVVVERLFDLLTFVLGMTILFVSQFDTVRSLYLGSNFPNTVQKIANNVFLLLGASVFVFVVGIVLYVLKSKWINNPLIQKLVKFKNDLIEGLKKVAALKQKGAFLAHTLFIWLMYFCMTYVCFFAYVPTASLGVKAGFAIFMAGSLGMIAPTNGGVGAWHYMVILALGIFGIGIKEAGSIANVAFAVMTGTVIVFGATAIILLPFINKNNKVKND